MEMRRAAGFAAIVTGALLAGGCGEDSPTIPAPAPTPAPAPAAPSPTPTVRAQVWVHSVPNPEGYYAGEPIQVIVDLEERVSVEGSPRLIVEIGERVRLADFSPWVEDDWPPERPSLRQRFEYEVAPDDEDADGITIQVDAFDFSEGAFLNEAGAKVEAPIYAIAPARDVSALDPGRALDTHRVIGQPPPRECTDERERALTHSPFVQEWDGTPFRVDVIRNFPDFVTEADLVALLEPVALLDEKIERQLGYRIVEMGQVIPVPEGLRQGWNEDIPDFARHCPLPRDPGQIHTIYMNDAPRSVPNAGAQAYPRCGAWAILAYRVGNGWPGRPYDETVMHELFHVFGFVHADDDDRLARGDGVPMSEQLTSTKPISLLGADGVLFPDIDLLRCIFPAGG